MEPQDDNNHQDQPSGAKKEFPRFIMGGSYPRGKIEFPTFAERVLQI